jgi:hypothetical protein
LFLLVDRHRPILAEPTRSAVIAELGQTSQRLEHVQLASGAWTLDWAKDDPPIASAWLPDDQTGPLLHATGHHLEWIALAPPELRPKEECIRKAVAWCFSELSALEPLKPGHGPDEALVCPTTHALISVYRSCFPDRLQDRWLAGR